MPPTLADRVRHILDAHAKIDAALARGSYEDFAADPYLRAAIERFLEMICEATRHIPDSIKADQPDIPWQRIVDFGNRLRHAYHDTDPRIVWEIATEHLRPLREFVERVVREAGD